MARSAFIAAFAVRMLDAFSIPYIETMRFAFAP